MDANDDRRLRRDAHRILREALKGADPVRLVAEALADEPEVERWTHGIVASEPGGIHSTGTSEPVGRTFLVSVGKAGLAMARGAVQILGDWIDQGVVLVPGAAASVRRPAWLPEQVVLRNGGHPIPDESGAAAAREIAAMVTGLTPRDRVLVLLSGGGSALLTHPRTGIDLEALRSVTATLLARGFDIRELNAVRSVLELLKGGGLARRARPARVLGLLLSDVVGDDPSVIASGPLSETTTTAREVEILMRRRGVWDELPREVRELIGEEARTSRPPAADDARDGVAEVEDAGPEPLVRIVGGGGDALAAASSAAARLGYSTHVLTARLEGVARRAGAGLARAGAAVQDGLSPPAPPACLLAAGETTVEVVGPGMGGRNQEVALGAALRLDGRRGILVASLGTDGVDGPTDAAGAVADGSTVRRARELGIDVATALDRNDAYPLLDALDDLIRTGPTGTNVADLMLVLIGDDSSDPRRSSGGSPGRDDRPGPS